MPTNIGKKIKKIRDSYNLSQDRFAKKIGLSGKTISAYETGRSIPPLKIVNKIAETYDTTFLNIKEEQRVRLRSRLELLQGELAAIKSMLE